MSGFLRGLLFAFFVLLELSTETRSTSQPNRCGDRCGSLDIPFPFYLNSSCGSISESFRLSCLDSYSLFLDIGSRRHKILQFYPDGVLVDFPVIITNSVSLCPHYNDFKSFGSVDGNRYFGISTDNVVALYDCHGPSFCRADCVLPSCDNGSRVCCYPLSDWSVWHPGGGFSVFSEFGCRGFSCWVVSPGEYEAGKIGVKLEWAIPGDLDKGACAVDAHTVNATSIPFGVRCHCRDGFVGDGFAQGSGCLKSCIKDGKQAYGQDCYKRRHGRRKVEFLAGVLTSAFTIASLTAIFCLLRRPMKPTMLDEARSQCTNSFRKSYRTRPFTYNELKEATRGFDDGQKLVDGRKGTVYAGVLGDGTQVAVQKVRCESEGDFIRILSRLQILSAVSHHNMAHLLGCCMDSGQIPLLVCEYPANGTLEEHLMRGREQQIGLEWYKRMNIAVETASVLACLQFEISPPICHHNLQSGCIFLDQDYSPKIAGFELLCGCVENGSCSENKKEGSKNHCRSDVYDLGVVLLEIISGAKSLDLPAIALQKIRSGKLEEIVDPLLYSHELPSFGREQIEMVGDLATRCLLFGGDGKLGMVDVARELMHISRHNLDGGGSRKRGPGVLEETFSNSSLLQMVSMSPDSIHVPQLNY